LMLVVVFFIGQCYICSRSQLLPDSMLELDLLALHSKLAEVDVSGTYGAVHDLHGVCCHLLLLGLENLIPKQIIILGVSAACVSPPRILEEPKVLLAATCGQYWLVQLLESATATPSCWDQVLVGSQGMCTEDQGCHGRVELYSHICTTSDRARQTDGRHNLTILLHLLQQKPAQLWNQEETKLPWRTL
jgi:hypothetical protein